MLPFTDNKIKRMYSWSGCNKVWNLGSQTEFFWSTEWLNRLYSSTFSLTILWVCGVLSTVVNKIQLISKALIRLLKGVIIWIYRPFYCHMFCFSLLKRWKVAQWFFFFHLFVTRYLLLCTIPIFNSTYVTCSWSQCSNKNYLQWNCFRYLLTNAVYVYFPQVYDSMPRTLLSNVWTSLKAKEALYL